MRGRTGSAAHLLRVLAPSPQNLGGQSYRFVAWSDGGAATHSIDTPPTSSTYTATFSAAQLGGTGFGLGTTGAMSWSPGTGQDGYQILRVSQAGSVTLPMGGVLPSAATSFTA